MLTQKESRGNIIGSGSSLLLVSGFSEAKAKKVICILVGNNLYTSTNHYHHLMK